MVTSYRELLFERAWGFESLVSDKYLDIRGLAELVDAAVEDNAFQNIL